MGEKQLVLGRKGEKSINQVLDFILNMPPSHAKGITMGNSFRDIIHPLGLPKETGTTDKLSATFS